MKPTKKQRLKENQEQLTAFVVENLKSGIPWNKCFGISGTGDMPKSISTGKRYSGGNCMWLSMLQHINGYKSNEWGTYNAWNKAGARILKGNKATHVIFYKPIIKTEINDKGEEETKSFFILKSYAVFNRQQTDIADDVDVSELFQVDGCLFDYIENQDIPIDYSRPNRAAYSPSLDTIYLPSGYSKEEEGYAVVAHEIIHSTGHKSRLKRDGIVDISFFGSHSYSYEELIAELGSMFLCNDLKLDNESSQRNSAAYLAHWANKLNDNPNWIWKAAGEASRATGFVLDCIGGTK